MAVDGLGMEHSMLAVRRFPLQPRRSGATPFTKTRFLRCGFPTRWQRQISLSGGNNTGWVGHWGVSGAPFVAPSGVIPRFRDSMHSAACRTASGKWSRSRYARYTWENASSTPTNGSIVFRWDPVNGTTLLPFNGSSNPLITSNYTGSIMLYGGYWMYDYNTNITMSLPQYLTSLGADLTNWNVSSCLSISEDGRTLTGRGSYHRTRSISQRLLDRHRSHTRFALNRRVQHVDASSTSLTNKESASDVMDPRQVAHLCAPQAAASLRGGCLCQQSQAQPTRRHQQHNIHRASSSRRASEEVLGRCKVKEAPLKHSGKRQPPHPQTRRSSVCVASCAACLFLCCCSRQDNSGELTSATSNVQNVSWNAPVSQTILLGIFGIARSKHVSSTDTHALIDVHVNN